MFCWVNDSACLEISVAGPGIDVTDLLAASKNIPNAFSACSMVFSAKSRNSAGTSSLGSITSRSSDLSSKLPHFRHRRCRACPDRSGLGAIMLHLTCIGFVKPGHIAGVLYIKTTCAMRLLSAADQGGRCIRLFGATSLFYQLNR